MNTYRILYKANGRQSYIDVESNSLAHAIWEVAKELSSGELIDTMALPSKENTHQFPVHVSIYPEWSKYE